MNRPWQEYCDPANWHAAANIFPLMPDDELQKLADDIKANGLKNPVIVINDKVLDGRNRVLACKLVDVRPDFESRNPEKLGSPITWVLSQNLHRRQLTTTQRAFIAVEAEKLFAVEAKQRQGTRTDIQAILPESSKGQARDRAAEALDVSPRSVTTAKAITLKAPAIAALAKAGKISTAQAQAAAELVEHHPGLAQQVIDGTVKPRDTVKARKVILKTRDLKARFAEKDHYRRIGLGIAAAFSGVKDRLDELTHIKKADWSPEAAEGIHNLIKNLNDVAERADEYASQFKTILKSNKKAA